jgi:ABC-type transport system involved in multi-copper enzyme maturation permease subunit
MLTALRKQCLCALGPGRLTGPIFDKELRVSSRRRRSYALRFFYILLLTVFVALVWSAVAKYEGNAAFQRSRMADVGKEIVTTIVLFQFVAMQLLAVIMLSNAISDEVYHRTLGLLMTTPITSRQIVTGKVLSKLLQLVLLLGISLPMLAIVRVFGGVSWSYLLSSLSITLTGAIFAGSLTLLFSIRGRRAYAVIVRTVFVLAVLYFFVPALAAAVWQFILPRFGLSLSQGSLVVRGSVLLLGYLNPVYAMEETTRTMLSPGLARFYWPIHCLAMLGLSALVLAWSTVIVRRVALWQATGQLVDQPAGGVKQVRRSRRSHGALRELPSRRVRGPAVLWRELRAPLIQGVDSRNSRIGLAVTVLALLLTYLLSLWQGYLDESFTHVSYSLMFMLIGSVLTVVFSATRITAEKESQTWPLLLTTSLTDWEILWGKAVSVFRRCLPVWALLGGHLVFFIAIGYIHPVALVHLSIVVAWLTCFITGAGLYFSTRFARTTSAVMAGFALTLGLWAVGPVLAGLVSAAVGNRAVWTQCMQAHPVMQTVVAMIGASGREAAGRGLYALEYPMETLERGSEVVGVGRMTGILMVTGAAYTLAGLLFLWRAARRLRRNVF